MHTYMYILQVQWNNNGIKGLMVVVGMEELEGDPPSGCPLEQIAQNLKQCLPPQH